MITPRFCVVLCNLATLHAEKHSITQAKSVVVVACACVLLRAADVVFHALCVVVRVSVLRFALTH